MGVYTHEIVKEKNAKNEETNVSIGRNLRKTLCFERSAENDRSKVTFR